MDAHQEQIEMIARVLNSCPSILFVTGAGLSADSGLPTYRGIGGLYDVEDTEDGLPIEEILSGAMLQSRPELTWKYLFEIANAARPATHNRGHEVIAEMEAQLPRVWTLTQNVDGFHTSAGSRNVVEIHGNMNSLSCMDCDHQEPANVYAELSNDVPRCQCCQGVMRPDVILFGEALPSDAISTLTHELEQGFSAVVNVGTSALFPYIREPLSRAKSMGLPTVEINPGETVLSSVADYRLELGAAEALDRVWSAMTNHPV